jgi:hypothetical protein
VLELARIPKYAVVIVPIAEKALAKMAASTAVLASTVVSANLKRAITTVAMIATSPPTTT